MKKRNILNKKWSFLRAEIERVRKELEISDENFKELNINKWKHLSYNIEDKFLFQRGKHIDRTWIWDDLKVEKYCVNFKKDPYEKLNLLITEDEQIYFLVNETVNEHTKYWYYEGKIKSIIEIIEECYGLDEYYLVSKKYDWLLCSNHHNILIGTGNMIPIMKKTLET